MKLNHEVQIKILNQDIKKKLPDYATEGSAGLDLRACIDKTIILKANEVVLIPTGIAINLNNPNLAAIILPRSGLGHKYGIVLGNLVGLIDSDYQGELKISLWNRSDQEFVINPFDRVAQMVIIPIIKARFKLVDNFVETKRNTEGFGSTGQK